MAYVRDPVAPDAEKCSPYIQRSARHVSRIRGTTHDSSYRPTAGGGDGIAPRPRAGAFEPISVLARPSIAVVAAFGRVRAESAIAIPCACTCVRTGGAGLAIYSRPRPPDLATSGSLAVTHRHDRAQDLPCLSLPLRPPITEWGMWLTDTANETGRSSDSRSVAER
jgi:hypothetical protein